MPGRRLILMRHAKSDWEQGLDDHARPLNRRGRRDAPRVAAELYQRGWIPDVVLASDSRRTSETWSLMAEAFLDPAPDVVRSRALYLAGLGALQSEVAALPPTVTTVLALGHNPGWEHAASRLADQPIRMTTANAVLLELATGSWEEGLSQPAAALHGVIRPREL